jgi:hypothetical protein
MVPLERKFPGGHFGAKNSKIGCVLSESWINRNFLATKKSGSGRVAVSTATQATVSPRVALASCCNRYQSIAQASAVILSRKSPPHYQYYACQDPKTNTCQLPLPLPKKKKKKKKKKKTATLAALPVKKKTKLRTKLTCPMVCAKKNTLFYY